MPEFICAGELTLQGVTFFIEAENVVQARFKAEQGQYDRYEIDGAQAVNWNLSSTVRKNT